MTFLDVVRDCPPSSPGLNAIEGMWSLLREGIEAIESQEFEDRAASGVHLRRCVAWLNDCKGEHMLMFCTSQKVRARDVQANEGAKTGW